MKLMPSALRQMIGIVALIFFATCLVVLPAQAGLRDDIIDAVDNVSYGTYDTSQEGEAAIVGGISRFTNVIIGFLGVLAVVLILYAGFLWTTAGGNEEQVKKAKKVILQTVIGIIIISSAFMLVMLVLRLIAPDIGKAPPEEDDKGTRNQPIHYLVDSNLINYV